MTLLLGAFALLALWWWGGSLMRLAPARRAKVFARWAAYGALGIAILFLLRGRLDLALLFGLGGVWGLDGAAKLGLRVRDWRGRFRRAPASGVIRPIFGADGRIADGTVMAGPDSGRTLSALSHATLIALMSACRLRDPASASLLEAYLDGREPGWRVDAERDPDPRARRSPDPGAMTEQEAYEILGLERGATLDEVRTAHRTLMKRSHPDQGGTVAGAARINAARDRLTNRHR
ncbi:MAG: DnaJ domain-containing protein [Methylobacterium sp.]|uniref:J domain-containing protein n=1 Tax=Methylobacterium sp. TaxID=409 RepID=UPI0025E681B0|nr:DnaJ domain-containing protein [Methylobacterium sp.]MBX9931563.1 DnaJ domain-containing protein [Methylobacterium sp.]